MGLVFSAVTAPIALATANTIFTRLQVVAAAAFPFSILSISGSFDGVTAADTPLFVKVVRQTDAGTMSALTPRKQNGAAGTLNATAQHTATAEPTGSTAELARYVHPQGGFFNWTFGPGQFVVAGGGRLGLWVDPGATMTGCNGVFEIIGEEMQ